MDVQAPKSYEIRTYGCQMNVHDSERLAGLLEEAMGVPPRLMDGAAALVASAPGATAPVREKPASLPLFRGSGFQRARPRMPVNEQGNEEEPVVHTREPGRKSTTEDGWAPWTRTMLRWCPLRRLTRMK